MSNTMQFTDLDSYFAIIAWWESWKTETLEAAEKFEHRGAAVPLMLINTRTGWKAAYPGDWITRDDDGELHVAALPTPPAEASSVIEDVLVEKLGRSMADEILGAIETRRESRDD